MRTKTFFTWSDGHIQPTLLFSDIQMFSICIQGKYPIRIQSPQHPLEIEPVNVGIRLLAHTQHCDLTTKPNLQPIKRMFL